MSSPQPFIVSSPVTPSRRKKSKFTFKQLNLLSQSSLSTPLRCISLIDLDAFYAQVETFRLNLREDQPLAVQQWGGLIAIGYPARAQGVTRFMDMKEAKKKCPQLICSHVATWREGDDKWAYRDDAAEHIHTDKVSLDPFRQESRKILALVKDTLPAALQKVEKASVDEVFLDLSSHIHSILIERYPELRHAPYDDPTEFMPTPPSTALNWEADALVDLDEGQTEDDDPDWDDVIMNIGSEIVRGVRKAIREKLKYTCSAGIAKNKMLAKLGAGFKKPNSQTIVRNRAVQHFLSGFKFTKIRNLGGKLGQQMVEAYNSDEVSELLNVSLDALKSKFGDDTGTWIHGIIRGEDTSEVNARTQIKSMLSAKSFRPSINSFEQAVKWLRIFVADIYARLLEEGVTDNKRRPKSINLHHRQGGQVRSKQLPISSGKKIDADMLLDLARTLLQQVIADGRSWPCSNLSLSVHGFEDGVVGNRGIGSFLVRGDEAKALETPSRSNTSTPTLEDDRPQKRRRLNDDSGIGQFFKSDSIAEEENDGPETNEPKPADTNVHVETLTSTATAPDAQQRNISTYFCGDCQRDIPDAERGEHLDWHYAKSLQAEDHATMSGASNSRPPGTVASSQKRGTGSKPRGGRGVKPEKGQSRLAFS